MKAEVTQAKKAIMAGLEDAVAESARTIRGEARRLVAVDTGTLRDNITAVIEGPSAKIGVFDPDAYYGQFVEFGTSDTRAQPFMTPAYERERKQFVRRLKKHVERKL